MELQESVLRSIGGIVGWKASPRYADYRGRLTERLLELVGPEGDWSWDGPGTLVYSEEREVSVAISPTELVIFSDTTAPDLGSLPGEVASMVLEQLAIPEVQLIGSGSSWLAAASSEEDLNSWLAESLGSLGRAGLYDPFGGRPNSFAFQAGIGDDDLGYEIELKPMTASEAAAGEDLMSDDEADFPSIALYLEVRRAKVGELKSSDAVQWFGESLEKNLIAAQKFDAALREDL
ncbi:MAG TPA: hypothetical protein VFJ64_00395 [Solirubrobacterales bacterium]|nr:hypothetical protein [Solirubrobacterales bacterium]